MGVIATQVMEKHGDMVGAFLSHVTLTMGSPTEFPRGVVVISYFLKLFTVLIERLFTHSTLWLLETRLPVVL